MQETAQYFEKRFLLTYLRKLELDINKAFQNFMPYIVPPIFSSI